MALFSVKYPVFPENRTYETTQAADRDTVQCIRNSNIENLYAGQSVGLNPFTEDRHDGTLSRMVMGFKDRQVYERGELPQTTFALIA